MEHVRVLPSGRTYGQRHLDLRRGPGRRSLSMAPTASTTSSTSGASCGPSTAGAIQTSTRTRAPFRAASDSPTTRPRSMTTVRCSASATPSTPRRSGSPSRCVRSGHPPAAIRPPSRPGAPCSRPIARPVTVGPKWTKSTILHRDNPAFNRDPAPGWYPPRPGGHQHCRRDYPAHDRTEYLQVSGKCRDVHYR